MGEHPDVLVTEQDRQTAREDVQRSSRGSTVGGISMVALTNLLAVLIADAVAPDADGFGRALVVAGIAIVFAAPVALGCSRHGEEPGHPRGCEECGARTADGHRGAPPRVRDPTRQRARDGRGRARGARRDRARASRPSSPKHPSSCCSPTTATRTSTAWSCRAADGGDAPGLPGRLAGALPRRRAGPRPSGSPTARRSTPARSCAAGLRVDARPCASRCRSWVGPSASSTRPARPVRPLDDSRIDDLETLANQAGARLGMLRVMAETQLQASTDGLTGLINRRTLENHVRNLRSSNGAFALVMADLDRFKELNDTHGHEAGDRALRIFAETLPRDLAPGRRGVPLRRRGVHDRPARRRHHRRGRVDGAGTGEPRPRRRARRCTAVHRQLRGRALGRRRHVRRARVDRRPGALLGQARRPRPRRVARGRADVRDPRRRHRAARRRRSSRRRRPARGWSRRARRRTA